MCCVLSSVCVLKGFDCLVFSFSSSCPFIYSKIEKARKLYISHFKRRGNSNHLTWAKGRLTTINGDGGDGEKDAEEDTPPPQNVTEGLLFLWPSDSITPPPFA